MSKVILLLGGNEGNVEKAFSLAVEAVRGTLGPVLEISRIYKSPPWGFDDPNWFLNQVVILDTACSPYEVLNKTRQIEKQLGRKKKTTLNYESRLIDIDVLFYAEEVVESSELQIPHPRLHLRRFTLEPLNELIPDFEHPVLKKNIKTLLQECPDKSKVWRLD